MILDLPPDTPDWIRSHCTAIRILKAPHVDRDGEPKHVAELLRDQCRMLTDIAHRAAGDLYLLLLELHAKGTIFTLPLDHYVDRNETLNDLLAYGFHAELVRVGWAFGFRVREGHPLLEGDEGCFHCDAPIEVGQQVVIMPGPDPVFHPHHALCLAKNMGVGEPS